MGQINLSETKSNRVFTHNLPNTDMALQEMDSHLAKAETQTTVLGFERGKNVFMICLKFLK